MNSGKDSGLIAQIQAEHCWVLFVWCFSHRLELALKDTLSDFTSPVDKLLMPLYHLYHKSSKKFQELNCLHAILKCMVKMSLKATGTRWIDHRIRAMGQLVDKSGLCALHMKEFIDKVKNLKTKATVEGRL